MSPDDIFAAQFWPWPDPAIKRDAQGRVLFVNAAFLGLYGGQVENWRGNAVGGWPAPQPAGSAPYRFETRMQGADGSEQVYDWIEQTAGDGNAFALARNVTVFMQAPQPDPTQTLPTHESTVENQAVNSAHHADAPTQHEPNYDNSPSYAELEQTKSAEPLQATEEAENFAAPAIEDVPILQAEQPEITIPQVDIPEIDIPSDADYALSADNEEAAFTSPPASAPETEMQREFERRALPIEDDSAVLGNNWRDAVIAKAVGAGEAEQPAELAMSGQSSSPVEETNTDGESIRILLAEDNAINALLTRTLLEAEGHTVDTVEDGALAVEAMRTANYDLIFMDMRMPNMDGLEATRKIRALPNVGRALPIIALTANAFDDDRNACFDSGMNDFMTKPVSAEELSEKVRDWTSEDAKARLMNVA
jgi:CheY-like chemotaxis protein